MSINTAEIPQIEGDLDAVDGAGDSLRSAGRGFADTGSDVHTTWQGLSGVYEAPEVGELLAATAPISSDSATIGTDVGAVGTALSAYAAEVRPIKAELERLRTEAAAFNVTIEGDDDWNEDEDLVNHKNGILRSVNAAVAAWQAAERTCASAINATVGGVQYRADDGDGTHAPEEHGYTAELLDGATAGDEGVPWGRASDVDHPWYEDAWHGVVSFGKGLVVDGLWGAVRGLGTMVGVDGWDAAGQAWTGIGKLALSLNPVAMVVDQTVGIPGLEKGELGATQLAAGKALIAYDLWGEDPARASGAVVGNVLGAVIGTKGAGAAVKAGTVARVGGAAARVFPRASELAASIGTKVGDLRYEVATSLNTRVAALTERLPTFGPQPALATAGSRAGHVFEMTPGTRAGAADGLVARIDDAGPAGARTSGAGPRVETGAPTPPAGGASALHDGARPGSGAGLHHPVDTPDGPPRADGSPADSPAPGGTGERAGGGGTPADAAVVDGRTGPQGGGASTPAHHVPEPDRFDPTDARDYTSGDPYRPGDAPHSPALTYQKGSSQPGWGMTSRGGHQPWMDYQEQVTGIQRTADGRIPEYHAFRSDGSPVAFDGHTYRGADEVFLDAKDGYRGLAFNPELGRFRGMAQSSVAKALRQLDALPEGARLEWHVSDPHGAAALRQLIADAGIDDLSIIYTPRAS